MTTITTIVALYGYLAPIAVMVWASARFLQLGIRDVRHQKQRRSRRAATT
jgi:hypothetical protein